MIIGSTSIPAIVESKNEEKIEIDQPSETDKEPMGTDESSADKTGKEEPAANEDSMDTDQANGTNELFLSE